MSTLKWIEEWYKNQCNGDWEHEYGIQIKTIDNPGWNVIIDLTHTSLQVMESPWILYEEDEHNWYGYSIKNKVFNASGDSLKLETLFKVFRQIVIENVPASRGSE